MIPLGLMQMIILPKSTINSIVQFVWIVFKILAPYLWDQAKLFLDNVEVKKPKTKYNNKKVAPKIRCYILEHIQNLDKVVADLERAEIIITKGKFQFC